MLQLLANKQPIEQSSNYFLTTKHSYYVSLLNSGSQSKWWRLL